MNNHAAPRTLAVYPFDWIEPLSLFHRVAHRHGAVFLDSALAKDARSCWSVIGFAPASVLTGSVEEGLSCDGTPVSGALPDILRGFALRCTLDGAERSGLPEDAPLPGVLGYLGFEAGGWCDVMPLPRLPRALPDVWLARYETLAVFHHASQRAWIVSVAAQWPQEWQDFKNLLQTWDCAQASVAPDKAQGFWRQDAHAQDYPAMVRRVVDHISAGDVFQINATWQFQGEKPATLDAYDLYRRLREISPAPFSSFLRLDDARAVASASPELFLQVDAAGDVVTRPIKGTRPRALDAEQDAALADALRQSPKDRAENLMIVDLMRNDLGRVSRMGSVQVPRLWEVEHFPAVHHLVSEVRSQLAEGRDAVDLLCAAFPPGSVTGAPKVQCLALIHALEPVPRGVYCGAFIHLGGNGALASSVLIRTMTVAGNTVLAQAGGGIVSDSDAQDELQEMRTKAGAMLRALAGTGEEQGNHGADLGE